ncbi:hypothetical protein [Sphingomonas oryzagri]|uniref:Uncharacterized protein n=1 Tax=Sphingomonas oryzagri TaxID=3042314 RepID=A0ABT6N0Z1_9SPHN|nr:hypothetical protein [Sphingomonas oryzagri]MDH7638970.1 hypothetical protein [Sphingomonas oryzagri]
MALVVAVRTDPVERRRVLPSALALTLGWIWFQAAFWNAYSPSQLIWDTTGATVNPVELWAAGDAAASFYIFTRAHDRFWGICLFITYLVQIVFHAAYGSSVISYPLYSGLLDAGFVIQIACLITGGDGIGQVSRPIFRLLDRHRSARRVSLGQAVETLHRSDDGR